MSDENSLEQSGPSTRVKIEPVEEAGATEIHEDQDIQKIQTELKDTGVIPTGSAVPPVASGSNVVQLPTSPKPGDTAFGNREREKLKKEIEAQKGLKNAA